MIVLDTNVVSEMMRPAPNIAVVDWLNSQAAETLYLSSITIAELRFGIGCLPAGRRQQALNAAADAMLGLFNGRVLPFDIDAAEKYAELATAARAVGKGFPTPDGYIAAIASANAFAVATRDVSAFKAAGMHVINPWKGGAD